jgi:hypothetical protein
MSNSDIRWRAFPRDALPEALFGTSPISQVARPTFGRYDLLEGSVVTGFVGVRTGLEYNPPCIFVVADNSIAETLSWLKVYAPETSPLSQFGRVISADDWMRFGLRDEHQLQGTREDRWASIIVGEALAQGDTDVELPSLPLSRASSCFSTAIARAASVYGTDEATHTCADRLRLIEADRRFARRLVSVNDLLPIWALAGVRFSEPLSAQEAVEVVLNTAEKYMPEAFGRGRVPAFVSLRDYPELGSDSIEERVIAFQKLALKVIQASEQGPPNGLPAALLAASAFLVGRSTSHAFLVRRFGRAFPAAPVWFGLIAALTGVETWDQDWIRATKIVERQIRARFDLADATGFDLCWPEFQWLASTFDGPDVFSSLPKLVPKAVSVEVLPGATCQFKLASVGSSEHEARASSISSARERELQAALAQFIVLAARTQQLLDGQAPPVQQPLGREGGSSRYSGGPRPKKPR